MEVSRVLFRTITATLPEGGVYPAAATDPVDVSRIGWSDFFLEPRLQQVIEAGLANNRDLRVAAANVLQARAQLKVQRADLLPTINASGSANYTNNNMGAAGGTGTGASQAIEVYQATADRQGVRMGKRVSRSVESGGGRIIKKK